VPAVIITAIAVFSAINRIRPSEPAHLLLLMLIAIAPLPLAGFGKPRSFLYLAPVIGVLLTLFFDEEVRHGRPGRVLALISLLLAGSVGAITNINFGTHPFKRNSVIPYQNILNFISDNAKGSLLVVSTDPVVSWLLRAPSSDRCADYFLAARLCLNGGRHYDSIVVISGHSNQSENAVAMGRFAQMVTDATANRSKVATFGAGLDEDASLKTRLTGVALEKTILTVDLYR
jgi:hypothetical protein